MKKYVIKREYSSTTNSIRFYAYELVEGSEDKYIPSTGADSLNKCEEILRKRVAYMNTPTEVVKELEL